MGAAPQHPSSLAPTSLGGRTFGLRKTDWQSLRVREGHKFDHQPENLGWSGVGIQTILRWGLS